MFEYYFSGAAVRLSQVVIYSATWIVVGCMIASIFRCMLGPEKVRKIFGDGTRRGLLTGWFIGMLLPVCSLGVIPIVYEMRRCGVKIGTIIAFGLTAPLFNPLSVLYGLTLSDPIAILSFSLCALLIVSFLGWVWDRFFSKNDVVDVEKEKLPTPGLKRALAVFHQASSYLIGRTAIYMSVAIFFSVVVAVMFPKGYLQNQVERDNLLAPVTVAAIATPIYTTPLLAMSQIGGMFQHGNSIGAAFSLLILGAGVNIGLLAWFGHALGYRRVFLFFVMLSATTIGLAYVVDKPLYPKGVEPAGHSHAFDVYTHPFHSAQTQMSEVAWHGIVDFWSSNEFGGTFLLLGLLVAGLIFGYLERSRNLWQWYCSENKGSRKIRDVSVPGWVLGSLAVVGLIASSIVGCYLYYPAPDDLFGDLAIVNAECVLAAKNKDWETADKWIRYSDDLSRRLEIGVFLRTGHVEKYQSAKAKIYREKLDILKEMVTDRDGQSIGKKAIEVHRAYLRMRSAFLDDDVL